MSDDITPAVAHGWTVMESLPDGIRDQLYALLDDNETPRD